MAAKSITVNDFKKDLPGKLSEDRLIYTFPVIYSNKVNSDKKTSWQIVVQLAFNTSNNIENQQKTEQNIINYIPILDSYYNDSKIVFRKNDVDFDVYAITRVLSKHEDNDKYSKRADTITTVGKNIGRSNQTNVLTQALRDALGKFNKHKKSVDIDSNSHITGVSNADSVNTVSNVNNVNIVSTVSTVSTVNTVNTVNNVNTINTPININDSKGEIKPAGKKSVDAAETRKPPMLLKRFRDEESVIDYADPNGTYVQPKKNGVRCVFTLENNKVIAYSRERGDYHGFIHIKNELKSVLETWHNIYNRKIAFDGEIYTEGVPLQTISGVARRAKNGLDDIMLDYHVFDIFIPEEPTLNYAERKAILDSILCPVNDIVSADQNNTDATNQTNTDAANQNNTIATTGGLGVSAECKNFKYVKYMPTFKVKTREDVMHYYTKFLELKYEGLVLRRGSCPYKYSYNKYHTDFVLKLKPFSDSEFQMVDYAAAEKGKMSGAVMFVFITDGGKKFSVTPAMPIVDRMKLYKRMSDVMANGKTYFENHYKDRKYTLQYDELSSDGVPQRVVMKDIIARDYEPEIK